MKKPIANTTRRSRSSEVEPFLKIIVTMRTLDASQRRFHRGSFTGILDLALVKDLFIINSIERHYYLDLGTEKTEKFL
jgi:hypothetical protein